MTLMLQMVTGVVCGVLFLLLGFWMWFYITHRSLIKAASNLPVLKPYLPIVGHAHHILKGPEGLASWLFKAIEEILEDGNGTFCVWIGLYPLVFVTEEDDLKKILNSSTTLDKADEYVLWDALLKDGLLTAPAKVWKLTSKHLHPLFHQRNVVNLLPTFNRNGRELVNILSSHVDTGFFNVLPHTMDTALQSACNFVYGTDIEIDLQSQDFRSMRKVLDSTLEILFYRIYKFWLQIDKVFNYLYSRELLEMREGVSSAMRFKQKITKESSQQSIRINSKSPSSVNDVGRVGYELKKTGLESFFEMYDILQQKYPQFTDESLQFELSTVLSTASDTVAIAVATALLSLAYHQEIQDKLFEEIKSTLPRKADVAVDDLQKMPYLDQVYKETLRWGNIVPFIARKTSTDLQLKSVKIPSGCTVGLNLIGLHMNAKIYKDPQKFDPERFNKDKLQENGKPPFLPFSRGPRGCIGKYYAELFTKTQIIHVVRNFKITTHQDIYNLKKKVGITQVVSEGYNLKVTNRI